jgi:hypothetical protein
VSSKVGNPVVFTALSSGALILAPLKSARTYHTARHRISPIFWRRAGSEQQPNPLVYRQDGLVRVADLPKVAG